MSNSCFTHDQTTFSVERLENTHTHTHSPSVPFQSHKSSETGIRRMCGRGAHFIGKCIHAFLLHAWVHSHALVSEASPGLQSRAASKESHQSARSTPASYEPFRGRNPTAMEVGQLFAQGHATVHIPALCQTGTWSTQLAEPSDHWTAEHPSVRLRRARPSRGWPSTGDKTTHVTCSLSSLGASPKPHTNLQQLFDGNASREEVRRRRDKANVGGAFVRHRVAPRLHTPAVSRDGNLTHTSARKQCANKTPRLGKTSPTASAAML